MEGLRVRGLCRNGHVTDATAAQGKATWRGICASAGCGLPVIARRIKAPPAPPPEPPKVDPPKTSTTKPRKKVVRVASYERAAGAPAAPERRRPDVRSTAPAERPPDPDKPPVVADKPKRAARSGRTEAGTRPGHAAAGYGYPL